MVKKLSLLIVLLIVPISTVAGTVTFTEGSTGGWVVPSGVKSIDVTAYGADGGDSIDCAHYGRPGGLAHSTLTVTPGETLSITVGSAGENSYLNINGAGGSPDGASGTYFDSGVECGAAGGGGSTTVKRGATVLIAAGGGGGSAPSEDSYWRFGTCYTTGPNGGDGSGGGGYPNGGKGAHTGCTNSGGSEGQSYGDIVYLHRGTVTDNRSQSNPNWPPRTTASVVISWNGSPWYMYGGDAFTTLLQSGTSALAYYTVSGVGTNHKVSNPGTGHKVSGVQ